MKGIMAFSHIFVVSSLILLICILLPSESEPEIFRQILLGKLDFHSERHPWIVDDNIAPNKPLDSAVLSRLKQFSATNKLKKMALRMYFNVLKETKFRIGYFSNKFSSMSSQFSLVLKVITKQVRLKLVPRVLSNFFSFSFDK
ncbi:hypothetical protein JHK82_025228 [Glycine max]|uniref:Calcium-dependent protein kinase SK5 n=1 Tax=Glycine soja TaxID=3848 RepID=A0A445J1C8_GLYSO|nr:hypothetical protein JHK87_025165 [Glycine soja]KAG5013084.1 hypothetical protein JHK86_025345 [Glycine max]KAG5134040.1 hypothetical protein JHK82_025228 [Glycine max]RZB92147.1 Calcium-dependent protein kinase SK5 [Glycine soja]